MRTFALSPAMQAYFDHLVYAGMNDVRAGLPIMPVVPTPIGTEETAFYNAMIAPLAAAITAAQAAAYGVSIEVFIPLIARQAAIQAQPVDPVVQLWHEQYAYQPDSSQGGP